MAEAKSKSVASLRGQKEKHQSSASIIELEFGKYRIRAGRLSGDFVARAFPKSDARSQGLMAEASGASETEAIETLKELLRARQEKRAAARRWEERADIAVPSKEEYIEALSQTNLSSAQIAMLRAQAIASERGISYTGLAKAAGYNSRSMAIKAFSRTGVVVADFIGVKIGSGEEDSLNDPARVLAFRLDQDDQAPEIWIMHEELRQAVWAAL